MASTAYNSASVIIPKGAGYKASTIYGWRPSVNVLQSIGITRNDANGSFRNQQGLIEFAAANVPRFNWDEGDSCPKLLVEPSRENLILYSEDFTNVYWGKNDGATIDSNVAISPDGSTTADRLNLSTSANSRVQVASGTAVSAATTYTLTCYMKSESGSVNVRFLGGGDLSTNMDETITVTEEWQRFTLIGDSVFASGFSFPQIRNTDTTAKSILIWGAQLEEGSYATSYIKTEATTQTRNADVISQTGLASLIGDSEGTLYLEAEIFDATDFSFIALSDGTLDNRAVLGINGSGSNFRYIFRVASTNVADIIPSTPTATSNEIIKYAISYATNDFTFFVNGTEIGSDTSGSTLPDGTLTNLELNAGNGGSSPFYGKISVLAWWQARLSNSVLESLTSYETYEEMAATLDYTID